MIIAPFIFFALAAIFNSVMDICREKFKTSHMAKYPKIFKPEWWDELVAYEYKFVGNKEGNPLKPIYRIPLMTAFSSAWHFFKSLMVLSLEFSLISILIITGYIPFAAGPILKYLALLGFAWNGPFNLFYNHILKSYSKIMKPNLYLLVMTGLLILWILLARFYHGMSWGVTLGSASIMGVIMAVVYFTQPKK
jgi:hypothetical protein